LLTLDVEPAAKEKRGEATCARAYAGGADKTLYLRYKKRKKGKKGESAHVLEAKKNALLFLINL